MADNEPVITLDFNLLLSPTRLPRRGLRTRLRVELSGLELQEHLQTRPCELCEVCPPDGNCSLPLEGKVTRMSNDAAISEAKLAPVGGGSQIRSALWFVAR